MISSEDTIAAIATPLGEGGLGVIRVSGPQALEIVTSFFHNSKKVNLFQAASHTCHVGTIQADAPIDQAVVTLFRAPNSYTGEEVVEISAHGNPFTLQKILNLCLKQGARLAGPGEFTERAFLHGKMDLTQAEAVADLIHAKTEKTHSAALAQLRGGLASKVRELRKRLLPLLAHVEVGLDHSDENHDFLAREHLAKECQALCVEIDHVLESTRVSKILREGLRVTLVGRPNVGKSSLLNALLKEDRAIVTPIAGTTRDTLEEKVTLQGIPVLFTDTAGIREHTQDPIERLGMERTRQSIDVADLVIGLFDGSEALTQEDKEVVQYALQKPHVWVVNKIDLPERLSMTELHSLNGLAPLIRLSTVTGDGLHELVATISNLALQEKAPASEAQWLLNVRHEAALKRAREALKLACDAAQSKAFEECVALELQTALSALGEIIGETTTDDLLGEIFSTFCIGK